MLIAPIAFRCNNSERNFFFIRSRHHVCAGFCALWFFLLRDCTIIYKCKCLYGNNSVYKFTQIGAHGILFMLCARNSVFHRLFVCSLSHWQRRRYCIDRAMAVFIGAFVCCSRPHNVVAYLSEQSVTGAGHTCAAGEKKTKSKIERKKIQKELKRKQKNADRQKIQHTDCWLYTTVYIARELSEKCRHGAIWNRQNHNIDCCKFCRAVNPFANDTNTQPVQSARHLCRASLVCHQSDFECTLNWAEFRQPRAHSEHWQLIRANCWAVRCTKCGFFAFHTSLFFPRCFFCCCSRLNSLFSVFSVDEQFRNLHYDCDDLKMIEHRHSHTKRERWGQRTDEIEIESSMLKWMR